MKHSFKRTLSLVLALVMALSCMSLSVWAENALTVGSSTDGATYQTIGAAYTAAEDGDTIRIITPGTYEFAYGDLIIQKNITIEGLTENRDAVILKNTSAETTWKGITINGRTTPGVRVTIKNLVIDGDDPDGTKKLITPIVCQYGDLTLENVTIKNGDRAIEIASAETLSKQGVSWENGLETKVTAKNVKTENITSDYTIKLEAVPATESHRTTEFTTYAKFYYDENCDFGTGGLKATVGTSVDALRGYKNHMIYKIDEKGDVIDEFTIDLLPPPNVARIDNTEYTTLAAAVAAVQDGDTITLLSDIDLAGESIDITGKTITLDMAGYAITSNQPGLFNVAATGDLTIKGDGTITGPENGAAFDSNALIYVDGGKLTIENGTLTATGEVSDGMYGVYALNGATATFGTEDGEGPTITSWFAPIGTNNTTSPATITVYGGTYTENAEPTSNEWWSYFCAPIYAASAGSYTINGGTFNGYYGISSRYSNVAQTIEINGGTFNSTARDLFLDTKTGSASDATRTNPVIKGGTFSFDPESVKIGEAEEGVNLVAAGSTASQSGDKFVVVNAATAVAQIGDKYYPTLNAAVAAASKTETTTIDLLKDVTETVAFNRKDTNIVLDLGGHTFTATGWTYVLASSLEIKNGTVDGILNVYGGAETGESSFTTNLTVGSDAIINGGDNAGMKSIVLWNLSGNNCYGTTINVNGTLNACLFVSGNIHAGNSVINVGSTARINSPSTGIALNGYAIVNVAEGAQITGEETGIEVRAGQLNVNGGTIIGNGIPTEVNSNGSGTTTTGAGIAVAQHTTKLNIDVKVNGGEIKGYTAFNDTNPENNTTTDKVTLAIQNGTFTAINGGNVSVNSGYSTGFYNGPSDPDHSCAKEREHGMIKKNRKGAQYHGTQTVHSAV